MVGVSTNSHAFFDWNEGTKQYYYPRTYDGTTTSTAPAPQTSSLTRYRRLFTWNKFQHRRVSHSLPKNHGCNRAYKSSNIAIMFPNARIETSIRSSHTAYRNAPTRYFNLKKFVYNFGGNRIFKFTRTIRAIYVNKNWNESVSNGKNHHKYQKTEDTRSYKWKQLEIILLCILQFCISKRKLSQVEP